MTRVNEEKIQFFSSEAILKFRPENEIYDLAHGNYLKLKPFEDCRLVQVQIRGVRGTSFVSFVFLGTQSLVGTAHNQLNR